MYFGTEIHTPQTDDVGTNQSLQELYEKECNMIIEKCKFILTNVRPYLKGTCFYMKLYTVYL